MSDGLLKRRELRGGRRDVMCRYDINGQQHHPPSLARAYWMMVYRIQSIGMKMKISLHQYYFVHKNLCIVK